MTYLLDSNALIDAKNRYYQMQTFPGYWACLLHHHARGEIASVKSVEAELRRGNDELADWARDNAGMFMAEADQETQTAFAEIAQHLAAQAPQMHVNALNDFLGGADPWLIAKAKVIGATVVTLERLNLNNRRKFLIPNICQHFGVNCINTFEMLEQLNAQFILAPAAP